MLPKYTLGQTVLFANCEGTIRNFTSYGATVKYYVEWGPAGLPMWLGEDRLSGGAPGAPTVLFNKRCPHVVIVDDFYARPDEIRALALEQEYAADPKAYKGKRTKERFLWPSLREEFTRLLGRPIARWLDMPVNGCFQQTGYRDPLVYHSDTQDYAAVIYLTPDAPVGAGTSFWRDRKYHCRRPPTHPLEAVRFPDPEERRATQAEIYTTHNVAHSEPWELVDRVGAVYNRLLLWDGQMIHSASSYEGLESEIADKSRLVQLFFFTVAK